MNYPLPQQPAYPQQGPPAAPEQQYAPSYPQAPAPQGYPQAPAYPPAQQYGYPPAQGYAPQPPYGQQAPAPVVNATIADFYNQPSAGGGPGLSWTTKAGAEKPIGAWFAGYVSRDVTNGDIAQQTNPQGIPQTFRDGRPKLQMKVALKGLQTSDGNVDHPEGEGTWYVRGQARDELTRAMAEAGVDGVPQGGAYVIVTLVQRRPNAGFRPTNIVQVSYTPAAGSTPAATPPIPAQAPAPAPVQQAAPAPAPAPVQQVAPPAPPLAPPAAPAAAPAPAQLAPQAFTQAAPAPQPPAGLDPNAAAILQQLTAPAAPAPA